MNYGRDGIKQKKKLLNSAAGKVGKKLGVTGLKLFLIVVVVFIISGTCLVFGSIQGIIANAPDINTIDVSPEGFATKIYDSDGNEIQTLSTAGANRISVDLEQIPEDLQHAFVAIEDERFYEHNGIDIHGILRAGYVAFSNGSLSEGASTLTQQLIKNNVFQAYNETTIEKIKRKVQEQYLAVKLETVMSKDDIMENYLNSINLGNGYYGVQCAAKGYFGKDVSELTISECAVIASITQNPTKYNPVTNPDDNKTRQQKVLKNMYDQHYITQEQYNEALADNVYERIQNIDMNTKSGTNSYYVDSLIDILLEDLQTQKGYTEAEAYDLIYRGGLQVYSTQDTTMQSIADSVINDPSNYPDSTEFSINYSLTVKDSEGVLKNYTHNTMLNWYKYTAKESSFTLLQNNQETAKAYVDRYKEALLAEGNTFVSESLHYIVQPQLSFSLIEQSTGYVKVLVGGRGDKLGNRTLNRATDSPRQPGSSIKPLAVYGPALDTNAITLATVIDDAPYNYSGANGKPVTNFTKGQYKGLMTVREAILRSQNIPAVKILTQITPQVGFNYLEQFGLSNLVSPENSVNGNHDVVQSLALGGMTYGVTNVDMSAAYATIANGGVYTKPIYYTKVCDNKGNVIIDNQTPETHTVLKSTTAWLLTNAMSSVITDPAGTGKAAALSNQPVAGKTGTTQNETDKWFCGFTPYYTASIWLGYDDNSKKLSTSINHTKIWHNIMEQIHSNKEIGSFSQPAGIIQMQVCKDSGKIPVEGLCDCDPRGSRIITEYFSTDNAPTETCDVHVNVNICNDTGKIASAGCTNITSKIMIKKPERLETSDAEYVITDDELTSICDVHSGTAPAENDTTNNEPTTQSNGEPSSSAPPAATTPPATVPAESNEKPTKKTQSGGTE